MTAGHAGSRRRARSRARGDESGFSLVEVVVALMSLTLVSVASASFFVSAVRTTADQSQRETALALATRALEAVQAVPVSTVLSGRDQASVQALVTDPAMTALLAQDVVSGGNYDAGAVAGDTPLVPLVAQQTLKGTTFTVRTAVDSCWLSNTDKVCTRATPSTPYVSVLRATVNVTWGQASCRRCSYATSALLDGHADPQFNIATSQPIIVTTTPQTTRAGVTVPITLTGVALANGANLSVGSGGGTFGGYSRVGTDGKKSTANWKGGDTPGAYTMALVNPDTGRAEFSSLHVVTDTVDDCTRTLTGGYYDSVVQDNDFPKNQGTLTITSQPARGTVTTWVTGGGKTHVGYQPDPADAAVPSFTLTYTTTDGGETSPPATLTVKTSGGC